jgi:Lrp/AsnC family leucine-responsive transcriptional regulator
MDATGRRILQELQRNGRISLAELGRRVALSPPAVADRVRRLEQAG